MNPDAIIHSLPIYRVSASATLDYREKETWMKLDWNESPRNASKNVRDAIIKFLEQHSLSYYPDVTSRDLISAIADRHGIAESCVSVFNGSDSALQHIFYAFLSEGSVFTTALPTYEQILQFVNFKKPQVRYFQPSDVLNVDYDRYEKECISSADVVYFINPHNPTGKLLSVDYLGHLARKYPNTLFVIDEAYMEFARTDESCINLAVNLENLIVTRTFSKAYGLAGIRLGFAVGEAENISLIHRIKNNKDINTLAQIAGAAAIRDTEYLVDHLDRIRRTKKWFVDNVPPRYRVVDGEANFVLVDYEYDQRLIDRFRENRILVRDRSDQHGLRNFLRITVGTDEQMQRVIKVMAET